MKLPQVPKPWNPAYRETWEVMTPRERRVSFLIDVAVVIAAFVVIGVVV